MLLWDDIASVTTYGCDILTHTGKILFQAQYIDIYLLIT